MNEGVQRESVKGGGVLEREWKKYCGGSMKVDGEIIQASKAGGAIIYHSEVEGMTQGGNHPGNRETDLERAFVYLS